jgi:hypothetical protein
VGVVHPDPVLVAGGQRISSGPAPEGQLFENSTSTRVAITRPDQLTSSQNAHSKTARERHVCVRFLWLAWDQTESQPGADQGNTEGGAKRGIGAATAAS